MGDKIILEGNRTAVDIAPGGYQILAPGLHGKIEELEITEKGTTRSAAESSSKNDGSSIPNAFARIDVGNISRSLRRSRTFAL